MAEWKIPPKPEYPLSNTSTTGERSTSYVSYAQPALSKSSHTRPPDLESLQETAHFLEE